MMITIMMMTLSVHNDNADSLCTNADIVGVGSMTFNTQHVLSI